MPERVLPVAAAVLATISVVVTGCGSDSSPSTSHAAGSTPAPTATTGDGAFVSRMLPYQLVLPAGWSVDPLSQGEGSDADEFSGGDGDRRLIVGHGFPEPGETVSDRVRENRADETEAPGCTSDPKQDRPIEVGGKPGILWSYTCAPDESGVIPARKTYYLSAQTIHQRPGHRRVGYRFTIVVPLAHKHQARPLLNRFLAGLRFLKVSDATLDS
jgi:hypothetical protein